MVEGQDAELRASFARHGGQGLAESHTLQIQKDALHDSSFLSDGMRALWISTAAKPVQKGGLKLH